MTTESKIISLLDIITSYIKDLKKDYADKVQDKAFKLLVDNLSDKIELLKFYLLGGDDVYTDDGSDGEAVIQRQNIRRNVRKQDPIEKTILDLEELKRQIRNDREAR